MTVRVGCTEVWVKGWLGYRYVANRKRCGSGRSVCDANCIVKTGHIHFCRNVGDGGLAGCSPRAQWRYVEPDEAIVVFARVGG